MVGYGPPLIDFSPLGQLGQVYFSAYDAAEKRRQQNEVPGLLDSIPKLMAQAEGVDTTPLKTAVQSDQQAVSGPKLPSFAAAQGGTPSAKIAGLSAATAEKYGLDPNYLTKLVMTESGGDPNAANPNSSARGLTQFTSGTAKQYGLSNPLDPAANLDAAARLTLDNKAALTQALGREPTAGELYLAHQQGAGGAAKLLANPTARAADLVGGDAIRLNGGDPNMTAGQFAAKWTSKFDGQAAKADAPAEGAQNAQFQIPGQGGQPQGLASNAGRMNDQQREVIRKLLANPFTRKMGEDLLTKMMTPDEYGFQTAGDTLYKTNKRSGVVEPVRTVSKPTTTEQEYEAAKRDGFKGSYLDYRTAIAQAGASKTEVTVGGAEKTYDAESGKQNAKRFGELQDQGRTAQSQVNSLKVMNALIDRPDFYSGAGAGYINTANKMLAGLGLKDPKAASAGEVFEALSNQTVLDASGGSLGAQISNSDRDFLMRTAPSLTTTKEGNRQLIDMRMRLAQRQGEVAKLARQYASEHGGRLDPAFEDHLAEWTEAHPLFPEASAQTAPGAAAPQAPASAAQAAPKQAQPSPVLDEARAAIARGAPRDAVIRRLRENGIDASGL